MTIRPFKISDSEAIKSITAICFDGVAIDQNIEKHFGVFAGHDWRFRKLRHIDGDIAANAAGIFVSESDGQVIGYISSRVDTETGIGNIANFAVLPAFRSQGIGRKLMTTALDYLKKQGMACVRIETLEQNPVGTVFYPRMGFQETTRQIHYAMPLDKAGT